MSKIKPDPMSIRAGAITVGDVERYLAVRATNFLAERELSDFQEALKLPVRPAKDVLNDTEQEEPE